MDALKSTRTQHQYQHLTIQPPPDLVNSNSVFDPKSSTHKPHNSLARQTQSQVDNPKSFADLRLKLGDKRNKDVDEHESLPSELSDDEWVEIVRYQKEQYDEE